MKSPTFGQYQPQESAVNKFLDGLNQRDNREQSSKLYEQSMNRAMQQGADYARQEPNNLVAKEHPMFKYVNPNSSKETISTIEPLGIVESNNTRSNLAVDSHAGHNHTKPTTSGNKRYDSLSDKSRAFYDGFKGYMSDTHKMDINLASGGRTQAEQNHIYGQGRTRPGNKVTWTKNSHHIGGNAMDIVGPNWYKDNKQNTFVANQMRSYAKLNPNYGAGFLKMSKDPNHVQFVY